MVLVVEKMYIWLGQVLVEVVAEEKAGFNSRLTMPHVPDPAGPDFSDFIPIQLDPILPFVHRLKDCRRFQLSLDKRLDEL